jgi:hypothetical protein
MRNAKYVLGYLLVCASGLEVLVNGAPTMLALYALNGGFLLISLADHEDA